MAYSMGQHLYNATYLPKTNPATSSYLTKVTPNVEGVKLYGTLYRDLKISASMEGSNLTFDNGSNYLLRLRIRRNRAYNLQIDLKLMNESNSGVLNENKYEEIKRIYVPRAENYQQTSTVVLYESQEDESQGNENESSKKVYAGILRTLPDSCGYYDVYDKTPTLSTPSYYYKDPYNENVNDPFTKIEQRSVINLPHTWDQSDDEDTFTSFDIVFSPKANNGGFNRIILQMVRFDYDNDITFSKEEKNEETISYQGLHIDETPITANNETYFAELYKVNNLLSTDGIIPHNPITHLGVWSHPDFIMSINGEEIRVGPSGYYELNDYEINSLGVVCLSAADKFTIDYQYLISSSS